MYNMSKSEEIDNNLGNGHGQSNHGTHTAIGNGHFSIELHYYKDPEYLYELDKEALSYLVGDVVYVKAQTNAYDSDVKMRLSDCYTKPSQQTNDKYIYYLINKGCLTDPNARILSQTAHETRFYFQDFEYSGYPKSLYVHCNAVFCKSYDTSRACEPKCNH